MNTSYNITAKRWKAGMARCYSSLITLLLAVTFTGAAYAQQEITVTGQVTDENSESLPGATIAVEGTDQGTTTDMNGMYTINVAEDAVLVFSFVGYETQQVQVDSRSRIDVQMNLAVGDLGELVVVGYGEQSRITISSSISGIEGETVDELPTHNVTDIMKGRIPGVRATEASGQPGRQMQIRVRGGSSINKSNDPLYIVDGFPRAINDVNPQDIKSLEVLKDAAATSIYGARASNGVVLITTKRGSTGTNVNLHVSHGFQDFKRTTETVDAGTLLQIRRQAVQRSPLADGFYFNGASPTGTGNGPTSTWTTRFLEDGEAAPVGWETIEDPVTGRTLVFQNNDLQQKLFRRAPISNYHLSMNGGTDQIRYYGGFGYTDEEGVVINSGWERFSGRMNVDYDASERLSLSANADFSRSNTDRLKDNEGHVFTRGAFNAPTIRDYFEDGTPGHGVNQGLANPEWYQYTRDERRIETFTTLGLKAGYELVGGLNLEANANYQIQEFARDYFERANVFNQQRPAEFQRNKDISLQTELLARYESTLKNAHHISVLGGISYLSLNTDLARASAFGASTDNIPTLNSSPNPDGAFSFRSEETLISQFGRFNYNYDYKYLLNLSLRRDGSSKFGRDNLYGYFPSASVGWIVSNENFFQNSSLSGVVSNLKLRTSYGQTGNNNIDRFIAQGEYDAGFQYAGNAGIRATQMPNQSLGWEKTTQLDIGMDVSFLDDRVNIIADYYTKETENLLFTVQLPRETGFNSVEQNVGTVKFNGFEAGLSTTNISTGDFSWTTSFNISYNINEVVDLPFREGVDKNRINGVILPDGTGVGGIAEGERLGAITGLIFDHLIDNQEQADNAHYDEDSAGWDPEIGTSQRGRKFPGDAEWVDQNGDGIISGLDQAVIGYDTPTTTGGFGNTFQYKGWQLTVFLDFALGHTIVDQARGWVNGNGANRLAATTDILNAWQQPGDAAHTNQPRVTFHDNSESRNHTRVTSLYAYNGDYLSVREVRLAYDLPADLLSRFNLQSVRLYAVGNNLHYFTEFPRLSPELGGAIRHPDGRYPAFRTVTLGIKVGL